MAYLRKLRSVDRKRSSTTVWIAIIGALAVVLAAVLPALISRCPRDVPKPQPEAKKKDRGPRDDATDAKPVDQPFDGKVDEVWEVATVKGHDEAGRTASFHFLTVSRAFEWELASSEVVMRAGAPQDFSRHLSTPGIQAILKAATTIIAVGASSQEGSDLAKEEQRALDRADRLELWVSEYVTTEVPLESLTLGRYIGEPAQQRGTQTGHQRRLVVVAVQDHDRGVDLEQALKSAIQKEPDRFPFTLSSYSKFKLFPRR